MKQALVLGADVLPTRLHPRAAPADYAAAFATTGLFASLLPSRHRITSLLEEPQIARDGTVHMQVRDRYRWNDGCAVSDADLEASVSTALSRFRVAASCRRDKITISAAPGIPRKDIVSELRKYEHVAVAASACSRPHLSCGPYRLVKRAADRLIYERVPSTSHGFDDEVTPLSLEIALVDPSGMVDAVQRGLVDVSPPLGTPVGHWEGLASTRVLTDYFAGLETVRQSGTRTMVIPTSAAPSTPIASGAYAEPRDFQPKIPVDLHTVLWVDFPPNRELLNLVQTYYRQLLGHSLSAHEVPYQEYMHRPNTSGVAKLSICLRPGEKTTSFYPLFQAMQVAVARDENSQMLGQFNSLCLFDWSMRQWN